MQNVLITGAAGFIGSQLALRLKAEGKNVVALVSNFNGHGVQNELFEAGITLEMGSVTDYDKMRGLLSMHEIDTVFHLAAYSIVRLSARDPMSTYNVNVMGTVVLLEACRIYGSVKKIVVASSDKAYGDHENLPYTEKHPLQPLNTYDTSKACMDMIARSYAHNYGMPIVVTRCSNVYGPGDRNWSRIIPNTIRRIINNEPPILYSDVENMEREFIFVGDVVDAYVRLGDSDEQTNGKAYNIGGTYPAKIGSLVNDLLVVMGSELKPTIIQRESTFKEIQRQYIDAWEIENAVGWVPSTNMIDGLKATIEWIKENK